MSKKKRVAIIGSVGIPSDYGGFEMLAKQLVSHLDDEFDFVVYCSGRDFSKSQRLAKYRNARLKYLPLRANGIQSILFDSLSIIHAVFIADVLLILGVAGAWILPFVKIFSRKKIVVLVNGIEWKHSRWNLLARWYFFWAEKKAINYSHVDILDNEAIQDYTALHYGSLSRVVEHGADHIEKIYPNESDLARFPFITKKYAFLDFDGSDDCKYKSVLEVFKNNPQHHLVVAGKFYKNKSAQEEISQLTGTDNIHIHYFSPPSHEYSLLKTNAATYIHAYNTAGTDPGLIEAMHIGIPAICFHISYNVKTTENRALYFKNSDSLGRIIQHTKPEEYERIADQLKKIAIARYNWQRISRLYAVIFNEALTARKKISITPKFAQLAEEKLIEMGLGHLKHQQSFFEERK
jgi:glycosyltransferase involved in cell wall biosynthesis